MISPCYVGKRRFCSRKCASEGYDGKSGGFRPNSGQGKTGWYKGIHCQSSWELAWVMYHLDHKIPFIKNKDKFQYEYEGVTHNYYPDFIMEDGTYIEIKGYMNPQWRSKIDQFTGKIKVLYKQDMKIYIDYAKQTYGNDYIRLYEGNPHNKRLNKCVVCGEPAKKMCCSRACGGRYLSSIKHNKPLRGISSLVE